MSCTFLALITRPKYAELLGCAAGATSDNRQMRSIAHAWSALNGPVGKDGSAQRAITMMVYTEDESRRWTRETPKKRSEG